MWRWKKSIYEVEAGTREHEVGVQSTREWARSNTGETTLTYHALSLSVKLNLKITMRKFVSIPALPIGKSCLVLLNSLIRLRLGSFGIELGYISLRFTVP